MGIDPGSLHMGWSLVEYSDDLREVCLEEVQTKPFFGHIVDRIEQIGPWLEGLIADVTPNSIVRERQTFHSPGRDARKAMALVDFEIEKAARKAGIPLKQLNHQRVYKIVTGHGHWKKEQLRDHVLAMFQPVTPWLKGMTLDESDAVAMALAAPYY
jgi:Holliday junction resolvasome RuvABC endonuclease subunit